MTHLLEKAFSFASKLSEPDQDAIAAVVLDELASEERWSAAFAKSQDALSSLAAEALTELSQGKTSPSNKV